MGTPKQVVGWEGEMKGNLTFPVKILYSFVTRTVARFRNRPGEDQEQIVYRIELDPKEEKQLKELIKVHAECEMNEYAEQVRAMQEVKPGVVERIIKAVH